MLGEFIKFAITRPALESNCHLCSTAMQIIICVSQGSLDLKNVARMKSIKSRHGSLKRSTQLASFQLNLLKTKKEKGRKGEEGGGEEGKRM